MTHVIAGVESDALRALEKRLLSSTFAIAERRVDSIRVEKEPIPTPLLRVALATVVVALAGACSPRDDPPRDFRPRLVLLYAPCTVNASYLSPFNQEVDFTPELVSFSEDSIVFTRHQTEAGHSGTAYAALFSGADALEHGVLSHPANLADSLYPVSETSSAGSSGTSFWARA